MKQKILSMALAVVLCMGLVPTAAVAYNTPDFSDVPSNHWAYEAVMKMADAGVIKGTGNGKFSPSMKLSAEMFVVLVGRVVFPDVKAEGADWSGPYITEAKAKGLLTGTNITDANIKGDISRYDMAVILAKCVELLKVSATKADSSKVTDYGDIPNRYTDAVLMAYGSGLIRGDQSGRFNGQNSMTRQEAATVMDRLLGLKGGSQGETTEPTTPPEPSSNPEVTPSPTPKPQMVTARVWGNLRYYPIQGDATWYDSTKGAGPDIPFKLFYTEDGGETSTLVTESYTTGTGQYDLEFPLDKRLIVNPNGQFYISARFEKDGQTFVTQDLRTDGRKAVSSVHVYEKGSTKFNDIRWSDVELVPPTGQKWEFDLKGKVPTSTKASGEGPYERLTVAPNGDISPAGFTVQLVYYPEPNLQDGIPTGERVVMSETKSDEEGKFVLHVSLDTLDRVTTESFRIEMRGVSGGKNIYTWEKDELRTLGSIKGEPFNAAKFTYFFHDR